MQYEALALQLDSSPRSDALVKAICQMIHQAPVVDGSFCVFVCVCVSSRNMHAHSHHMAVGQNDVPKLEPWYINGTHD